MGSLALWLCLRSITRRAEQETINTARVAHGVQDAPVVTHVEEAPPVFACEYWAVDVTKSSLARNHRGRKQGNTDWPLSLFHRVCQRRRAAPDERGSLGLEQAQDVQTSFTLPGTPAEIAALKFAPKDKPTPLPR